MHLRDQDDSHYVAYEIPRCGFYVGSAGPTRRDICRLCATWWYWVCLYTQAGPLFKAAFDLGHGSKCMASQHNRMA